MVVSKDTSVKKTVKSPVKKIMSDAKACCDTEMCSSSCMTDCATGSCCSSMHKVRGIVVVLLLIANLASVWYGQYTKNDFEIMRNGGRENYEKIQAMMQTDSYIDYATQGVDAMIMQQMQQQNQQMPDETMPTDMTSGTGGDENGTIPLNGIEDRGDA